MVTTRLKIKQQLYVCAHYQTIGLIVKERILKVILKA